MAERGHDTRGAGSDGRADRTIPAQDEKPATGPPCILIAQMRRLLRDGRYIRSVLVEHQSLDAGGSLYTVYLVGSWHTDWHILCGSQPATPRTYRNLDRLIVVLRTQLGFQGEVVVRTRRTASRREPSP